MQVAREEFRRRHGVGGCSGSYAIAEALVGKEEERPVAAVIYFRKVHRPARGDAEVVLFVHGLLGREKAARVQFLVAQELVGVPVKIVGARFGNEAYRAAGSVSGLGLESAGFHAEFRERLDRRGVDLPPAHLRIGACDRGRGAVQGHAESANPASADRGSWNPRCPRLPPW